MAKVIARRLAHGYRDWLWYGTTAGIFCKRRRLPVLRVSCARIDVMLLETIARRPSARREGNKSNKGRKGCKGCKGGPCSMPASTVTRRLAI